MNDISYIYVQIAPEDYIIIAVQKEYLNVAEIQLRYIFQMYADKYLYKSIYQVIDEALFGYPYHIVSMSVMLYFEGVF